MGLDVVPGPIGLLALALLGAMLGFAVFNKHPAQIFLGDAGSLPIGLLLAFMLIFVAEAHLVSGLLLALYTLSEATITFFRRLFGGEPVFSAHKSHFYQRAVAHGLRVPQVTLARIHARTLAHGAGNHGSAQPVAYCRSHPVGAWGHRHRPSCCSISGGGAK